MTVAITTSATTTTPTRAHVGGVASMVRIQLRTGWKPIVVWVGSIVGTYVFTIAAVDAAYPDAASLQTYGDAIAGNAAVAAINGTPYGATNLGGVTANEFGFMASILFPVMATHLIARSTRTQEASGLLELVRSRSVARWAPTTAAITTTVAAIAVITVGIFCSALAFGIDLDDAALYALSLAGLAVVWVGIAAVVAQLVRLPGNVYTMSLMILGGAYATRAIGDVHDNAWKWLSPLAWQQETRPFAADSRWWPLLLAGTAGLVLIGVAVRQSATRDLGSGILATRAGPERAGSHTRSTLGLAFGEHRAAIAGWTAGAVAVAVVFGALSGAVAEALPSFASAAEPGSSGGDVYLAFTVTILVLMASGYTVQGLAKLRASELDGSLEPTLARPVSRVRWLGAHFAVVTAGFVVITFTSVLALGVTVGDLGSEGNKLGELIGAGAAYLPAIAAIAGASLALFGWLPRLQTAMWLLLGYSVFIAFVGPTLDVNEWVLRISPLYSVGFVPADDPSASGIAVLCAVAVALAAVGFGGFRRRDIPTN